MAAMLTLSAMLTFWAGAADPFTEDQLEVRHCSSGPLNFRGWKLSAGKMMMTGPGWGRAGGGGVAAGGPGRPDRRVAPLQRHVCPVLSPQLRRPA
eukprot:2417519-Rhodomonas_salina.2